MRDGATRPAPHGHANRENTDVQPRTTLCAHSVQALSYARRAAGTVGHRSRRHRQLHQDRRFRSASTLHDDGRRGISIPRAVISDSRACALGEFGGKL